ncbi:MAG: DNA polymerase III subunit delta [Ruminococcaceae bacterium]|nr:DNA polymerase III subunit delta [Oscillospiraceae bacterium]
MAKVNNAPDELSRLKAAIKERRLERLYFFHGEEGFLLHHYLNEMRRKTIDELTWDFNYHRFTQETFSVQDFSDAVEALPMMAESTFVQVDEIDIFKLNEAEREKMIAVLSDVPDYCTVVFTYEIVEWKPDKRLKKLWDAVSKHGTIVEFAKQSQRDLIAWVTRHFASYNKRISFDLCVYLIDITGGTMTALQGEIKKIAAYSGSDTIVRADIDAVTEPVLDAVVFQMTDLLGAGKYGEAMLKLHTLFKMQQEPIVILGAVGGHFRRISAARTLMDCGKTADDLMRLTGLKDYPARKTMGAAKAFNARFCRKAAELILETDYKMKTSFDEQERLLELLILQLAQEARNG